MARFATSLLDVLVPPRNRWLIEFVPGITVLPGGVRVIRHAGADEDRFDRIERLRIAKRKLHDWMQA